MSIKLNVCLEHLQTVAAAISGMHAERVHIGPIEPSRVGTSPHIIISLADNKCERIDGADIRRMARVTIAVLMRIDTVKGEADLQINEIYEPMHAAFEALRDGISGKFHQLVEVDGSLEYDTLIFNQVPVRAVSANWDLTFDRALGATE